MKWSNEAMKESFYFSNICPQHPELNRRKWKDLEDKVREWAVADSSIFIVCGPIMNKESHTIGKNQVAVPTRFFKVILSLYGSPPKLLDLFSTTNLQQNHYEIMQSQLTALNSSPG